MLTPETLTDPAVAAEQRRRDAAWRYRRQVLDLLARRADLQGVSHLADLMSDGARWAA